MSVIRRFYPNWHEMSIHESSPGERGVSPLLARKCSSYQASQYDPSFAFGQDHSDGWRNENLEAQTYGDGSFDLVITQDVFEHLFRPDKAIAEIARTLKPGGAHICTTPLVAGVSPSRRRASLGKDGQVVHHHPPEYHQNPVDPEGSLVTVDWGYDIAAYFDRSAPSLTTTLFFFRDTEAGIEGELTEVLMSTKAQAPSI